MGPGKVSRVAESRSDEAIKNRSQPCVGGSFLRRLEFFVS